MKTPCNGNINRGLQVLKQEGILVFLKKILQRAQRQLGRSQQPQTTELSQQLLNTEPYKSWIEHHEPDPAELARQKQIAENFPYKPIISIIVPVYNPDPESLEHTINSVMVQTYPFWELCLADGASSQPGVRAALTKFANLDQRIRVKYLEQNLGISLNSNAAMQIAQGEFFAFLDQDDLLAPFALYEVAQKLNQDRLWDVLYSDHDLLTPDGSLRKQSLLKPDWSPEIMLSANYLTHLTVVRASLVREIGGFDPQMDGAQDWDLFLKVSEKTQKIVHIAKILYHWRESLSSTATNIWSKEYAPPAQLRTIGNHLTRLGLSGAEAYFDPSGYIRVHWEFDREKLVSIIIPSQGSDPVLERCIASFRKNTAYPNYEIIIVNNGQKRPEEFPYYQKISAKARIKVIHDEQPFNYSEVNNFGARHASGDILLFLNNDTEIFQPDWLDELVMWVEREEVGIVGAKLLLPDGKIQHAGVIIGMTGFAGHIFGGLPEYLWTIFGLAEWYRNYNAVTAACMIIRKEVFEQIGGFDETFILCGSDVEICLRAVRAGLRIVYNPFARLRHLEGATRAGEVPAQDFRVSYGHYLPILQAGDPYFNPGLSYWKLAPTLAAPNEVAPLDFALDFLKSQNGNNLNVDAE